MLKTLPNLILRLIGSSQNRIGSIFGVKAAAAVRAKLVTTSLAVAVLSTVHLPPAVMADEPLPPKAFLARYCADCHSGEAAEAGLNLETLGRDLDDVATFGAWTQVVDRTAAGQMPPADADQPPSEHRQSFVDALRRHLVHHNRQHQTRHGRTIRSRLNR